MNVLRMLMAGACLMVGMTVVLAQDQTAQPPPQKGAKGKGRPGEFNARPAQGERYQDTLKAGAPAPDLVTKGHRRGQEKEEGWLKKNVK